MSNTEVYKRTLTFSIRKMFLSLINLAIFAALCAGGFFIVDKATNKGLIGLGIGAVIGIPTSLASIPFFISGKHKKNNAYQVYNEYCAKPTATLSFGPATKGIGMGVYLNF